MEAFKAAGLLMLLALALVSPMVKANIGDFDETWRKRAEEATKAAHDAYTPNPEEVANNLNEHVHK